MVVRIEGVGGIFDDGLQPGFAFGNGPLGLADVGDIPARGKEELPIGDGDGADGEFQLRHGAILPAAFPFEGLGVSGVGGLHDGLLCIEGISPIGQYRRRQIG